jgi:hypothetical protein
MECGTPDRNSHGTALTKAVHPTPPEWVDIVVRRTVPDPEKQERARAIFTPMIDALVADERGLWRSLELFNQDNLPADH